MHQALEHGTPPYLEIVALAHALDWLARVTNGEGLGAVARHVGALREVAVRELSALQHEGGGTIFIEHQALRPEPGEGELDEDERWRVVLEPPGPIVGFSLLLPPSSASASSSTPTTADADESDYRRTHVGHEHIARLALLEGIALRSGGMCNAGAVSRAVGMGEEERRQLEELGSARCWNEGECGGKTLALLQANLARPYRFRPYRLCSPLPFAQRNMPPSLRIALSASPASRSASPRHSTMSTPSSRSSSASTYIGCRPSRGRLLWPILRQRERSGSSGPS